VELQEIVQRLQYFNGVLPRPALRAAIAQQDTIIPALLKLLAYARNHAQDLQDEPEYMAHLYVLYLLAQFREPRAYPLIVAFFSLPGDLSLDLTGDVVTEDLDRILASVCGGDTSLIKRLAEHSYANAYVRNAALRALVCLVAWGEKTRDEVLSYYKGLFHGGLVREPHHVWDGLVSCCTDLYPGEVYDEIQQAFREGLVDDAFIDLAYIEQELARGKETVLAKLHQSRYGHIQDTIAELEGWASFQPARPKPLPTTLKVGRNAPCPCGSGKKYKKCCGR
jgi:Protein of unknown function (DUF1186)/SEC-C motif